ncbi:unnamed protein product [Amoebophrya sp. A120]|nr:unnamed protein product [Amoebophrya sp. A120]|eukprot:GSA120T00015616001.1
MKFRRTMGILGGGAAFNGAGGPKAVAGVDVAQLLSRIGTSHGTGETQQGFGPGQTGTCDEIFSELSSIVSSQTETQVSKDEFCSMTSKNAGGNANARYNPAAASATYTLPKEAPGNEEEGKKESKKLIYTCCTGHGFGSFVSCC